MSDCECISVDIVADNPINVDIVENQPIEVDIQNGGVTAFPFTSLTDVPHSYSGASLQVVRVKSTEDGLEFSSDAGGNVISNTTSQDFSVVVYDGTSGIYIKRSNIFIIDQKVYFDYPNETYIGWNTGNQALEVKVGGTTKESWDNS